MQDLSTIEVFLKENDFHLSIETNGTILVDSIIDWICVSPDQMYPNSVIRQRFGNELKVVYCGKIYQCMMNSNQVLTITIFNHFTWKMIV